MKKLGLLTLLFGPLCRELRFMVTLEWAGFQCRRALRRAAKAGYQKDVAEAAYRSAMSNLTKRTRKLQCAMRLDP